MHDALSRNARLAGGGLMLLAVAVLAGCSGGSGAATQEIPGRGTGSGGSSYNGPPPATADVQSFKINFYDNIRSPSRCGSCHGVEGGQAPMFARSDDVNLAYAAANTVVTLTSPKDSVMVRKVAGGHNCWLASPLACAEILETWIANWAGALASSGDRRIELKPPRLRDPGKSKSLPADPWLEHRVSAASPALLELPLVELRFEAATVLCRRSPERFQRRGHGLRGGEGADQPG
jgi:hypothetical protein